MAVDDLNDGDVAVWIPNEYVLSESTADPAIHAAVDKVKHVSEHLTLNFNDLIFYAALAKR